MNVKYLGEYNHYNNRTNNTFQYFNKNTLGSIVIIMIVTVVHFNTSINKNMTIPPLYIALYQRHENLFKYLMEHGIDVMIHNISETLFFFFF